MVMQVHIPSVVMRNGEGNRAAASYPASMLNFGFLRWLLRMQLVLDK